MDVFTQVFRFMWSLLEMSVDIGNYHFSLGGAVVFAGVVLLLIAFLRWLFADLE